MYKKGDIVLVSSLAGPTVYVELLKYVAKPQDYWEAILVYEKDVKALKKAGVPYPKIGEREVWVFDEEIIKKEDKKRKVR